MKWNARSLLARRSDKKFGDDLRTHLVRLFTEHSARIIENDESDYVGSRSFDYAVAIVGTPHLDLRFVRVRGEFAVQISLPSPHRRWDSLDSALLWLAMKEGIQAKPKLPRWGYGEWERLKSAAGAAPYLRG